MEFFYKGIDQQGKKLSGTIEALTQQEAKAKLLSTGIFISLLTQDLPLSYKLSSLFLQKELSYEALSKFCRDLAVYLNSGIPLRRSLHLIAQGTPPQAPMTLMIQAVIGGIDDGKTFSQALLSQKHVKLPLFVTTTLKISEDRGVLSDVLVSLSTYLQERRQLEQQIQHALIYPSFIIAVAVMMVVFMLSIVIPKISTIFENMGQQLPPLTRGVIALSQFVSHYWLIILVSFLALLLYARYKIQHHTTVRYQFHNALLRLPFIGSFLETSDLSRFSAICALLLRSGVPLVPALRLGAQTLANEPLKHLFQHSVDKVIEGSRLSHALATQSTYPLDKSFVEAIQIGEETSEVARMLSHLSTLYSQKNQEKITLFLSLLEPTLMITIGGIIGLLITAMLLPIFSLNLG